MDKNSEEFKCLIYDLVNGSLNLEEFPVKESKYVENEFQEDRECYKLYMKVYNANRRLCERLGVDEDSDVETIISGLLDIGEILGKKMYEYGFFFAIRYEHLEL